MKTFKTFALIPALLAMVMLLMPSCFPMHHGRGRTHQRSTHKKHHGKKKKAKKHHSDNRNNDHRRN